MRMLIVAVSNNEMASPSLLPNAAIAALEHGTGRIGFKHNLALLTSADVQRCNSQCRHRLCQLLLLHCTQKSEEAKVCRQLRRTLDPQGMLYANGCRARMMVTNLWWQESAKSMVWTRIGAGSINIQQITVWKPEKRTSKKLDAVLGNVGKLRQRCC